VLLLRIEFIEKKIEVKPLTYSMINHAPVISNPYFNFYLYSSL